jgi:hypothetical protein
MHNKNRNCGRATSLLNMSTIARDAKRQLPAALPVHYYKEYVNVVISIHTSNNVSHFTRKIDLFVGSLITSKF